MSTENIASYIDHTILNADAGADDIQRICEEAKKYAFKSVCVNPIWVSTVSAALAGSGVLTCSVIGFPFGATPTASKVFEATMVVAHGAHEVDMVINIAAAKAGDEEALVADISAVAKTVHSSGAILKVIIETALLTDAEKVLACGAAVRAGADFVKTSTGFAGGGATLADVTLMRTTVGPEMGVKASGGVRSLQTAREMIAAGATRLGSSSGVAIVEGEQGAEGY